MMVTSSDTLADLGHADTLASEDVTDVRRVPAEADPAAAGRHDRLIVERIRQLLEASTRIRSRRNGCRSISPGPYI